MHQKRILMSGAEPVASGKAIIMVHGRGGTAEDILTLSQHLDLANFSFLAPQATNHTWYPLSFLAAPSQNEPWLSSAINLLREIVDDLMQTGIDRQHIYMLGFSQGACLTLEFAARNAAQYGGIIAFTGGLIGDQIYSENYKGDFMNTPIFIGSSDPDPHVPVERVYQSAEILRSMNANVLDIVYPNMGHTISAVELARAKGHVFG